MKPKLSTAAIWIIALFSVNLTYAIWPGVDPHTETYYPQSPYVFAGNNPVNRIDPDGRDNYHINSDGSILITYTDDKFGSDGNNWVSRCNSYRG